MKRPISGTASRSYAKWQALGVARADGEPFPQPNASARAWLPVAGGLLSFWAGIFLPRAATIRQ
jgi:membrane-bound lytic murein transglycosylase B